MFGPIKRRKKRIHDIHHKPDGRLVDPDMFKQEDFTIGHDNSPQLFQTQDRVGHRAEHERRDGRIKRIFGKWKRLNITLQKMDWETKIVSTQSCTNQHLIGNIDPCDINSLRIIRKVFPCANPDFENLPPDAGKQFPAPATEGVLGYYFHHIIAWGNSVVARLCLSRQIPVYLIHLFFQYSMTRFA